MISIKAHGTSPTPFTVFERLTCLSHTAKTETVTAICSELFATTAGDFLKNDTVLQGSAHLPHPLPSSSGRCRRSFQIALYPFAQRICRFYMTFLIEKTTILRVKPRAALKFKFYSEARCSQPLNWSRD